jgi:hypothetical protein
MLKPDSPVEPRNAPAKDLDSLVHEADEDALVQLLENANLAESHVKALLERLDISAKVLGAVAANGKWTASEAIRLSLARHPHTPRRIAIAAVRQLFLFDLVRLSLQPAAPAEVRRIAEEIILTRVPHLPAGEKLTLARRGPARVVGALLAEGHAQAVPLALDNPFLTESQVLKALARTATPARAVAAIAQHRKWSCQYNVRVALLRNAHTPVPSILAFLPNLTLRDLKDVLEADGLSVHTKKYIQQELARRSSAKS